jgi:hypothetical protein
MIAMLHGSATPPEIQEQAHSYALELWGALETEALREGLFTEQELERIKPKVLRVLALAFSRGSLVVMKAGVDALQKMQKSQGKKRGFRWPPRAKR